jgi:hypothetical protein
MQLKTRKLLAYLGLLVVGINFTVALFVRPAELASVICLPLILISAGLLAPIIWYVIEKE